jgi:hypothetical protein
MLSTKSKLTEICCQPSLPEEVLSIRKCMDVLHTFRSAGHLQGHTNSIVDTVAAFTPGIEESLLYSPVTSARCSQLPGSLGRW